MNEFVGRHPVLAPFEIEGMDRVVDDLSLEPLAWCQTGALAGAPLGQLVSKRMQFGMRFVARDDDVVTELASTVGHLRGPAAAHVRLYKRTVTRVGF